MDEVHHPNPMVSRIQMVQAHVADFRQKVRSFYFDVILSTVKCPQCEGRLKMIGQSQCRCKCGVILDPTVEFQYSPCCGARLVRKTYHYACSACQKIVSSRFLFGEKVFNREYFRQLMRESRERKRQKREEIRKLLAESRSETLSFMEEPDLESIPGLLDDLENFIEAETPEVYLPDDGNIFNIENYRKHILSLLSWSPVRFHKIVPMEDDRRRDRVKRFITLIFMQNDQEVEIEQLENDLLIQRTYNEAHA